ncbi:MAG: GerMN domain-containing protein [Nitrolancea sp.]
MHLKKRTAIFGAILTLLLTILSTTFSASAAPDQASFYLVAIGDNGQSGPAVGCGDSLVAVTTDIGSPSDTEGKISAALGKLFAIHDQYYGESGLYDALYNSSLQVDSVNLNGSKAVVNLSGSFSLGGVCDDPRAIGQIESTVTQFSDVDSTNVYLNGILIQDVLSGKGTQPDVRYFPKSGHSVGHGFLKYWENFGGLPTFGYPITDEMQENGTTVQYFQRARFEWHPGAAPQRYDVLLGLLGNIIAAPKMNDQPFQPVSGSNDANCTFYQATGHRLCFGFRDYWKSHGGLAIFGYPISEEFQENGVTVQYFERQRLEYHPENSPQWQVEGGLLGTQVYNQMY